MNTPADKNQTEQNTTRAAGDRPAQKQNIVPQIDSRPEALQMKQLQEMADQYAAMHKPPVPGSVVQGRFIYPQGGAADLTTTALYRLRQANNPLISEVEGKDEWVAIVNYTEGPFTASPNREEEGAPRVNLNIPGKDDDKGADIRQKNETSTYHETVHARAIFNNEFDLAPMVYHTVIRDGEFHGREAIPLEEALTVGFQDNEHDVHSLHRTTDMKDLSTFTDEDWDGFAARMKNRYKRIYGEVAAVGQNGATENKHRAGEKRLFYEAASGGKDEAWSGDGQAGSIALIKEGHKASIEKRKKDVEEINTWYVKYAAVTWADLQSKIRTAYEEDDEDHGAFSKRAGEITQENWTSHKTDFTTKYDEIKELYPDLQPGGNFQNWIVFKTKADSLLDTTKELQKILSMLNLIDTPIDMDNLWS